MTPSDWSNYVQGWNEAQSGSVPPPTVEQLEDLKQRYPD